MNLLTPYIAILILTLQTLVTREFITNTDDEMRFSFGTQKMKEAIFFRIKFISCIFQEPLSLILVCSVCIKYNF